MSDINQPSGPIPVEQPQNSIFPDYKTIRVEIDNKKPLVWLILNRPKVLNALNLEILAELHDFLDRVASSKFRLIILRGAGRGFCAGADLKSFAGKANPFQFNYDYSTQKRFTDVIMKMRSIPQPIIAAVHGAAVGMGFCYAMAADIRICSKSAKFLASFVKLGLSGGEAGSTWFLPRFIGLSNASELLFTGKPCNAERAFQMGLVSNVVEDEKLEYEARKLAYEILEHSWLGLRFTKEALNMATTSTLEQDILLTNRNQLLCLKDKESQKIGFRHAMKFAKSKL